MPFYDRRCETCGKSLTDLYERIETENPACECGGTLVRAFLTKGHAVAPDDIPGGIEIQHALCNPDGSPRRYYSRSAIEREAARRGYTNYVVHTPTEGTDKSKHTVRWVGIPLPEEERLATHWT